ncbi:MAG: hypothetical protein KIT68_07335 [Phycisphaeraceae bacterium]|nr:hypothetical protein [Phycisphaeraceae bacterium]
MTTPPSRLADPLAAARQAVGRAAAVTRYVQHRLTADGALTKRDRSVVTIGDFAAQAVVARSLHASLGPITLVGEESSTYLRDPANRALLLAAVEAARASGAWPDATADDLADAIDLGAPGPGPLPRSFWTLDPIDGTKGFIKGRQYAVCLARIDGSEAAVAALACPNLSLDFSRPYELADPVGSTYFAARGAGAWAAEGDDPATPATRLRGRSGDACTRPSITYSLEPSESRAAHFNLLAEALGDTRAPAALDSQCKYAVVARGQADCYYRPPRRACAENIWDHASGCLICAEAGCTVTDCSGRPLDFSRPSMADNDGTLAAPPALHARILRTLADLRSRR